MRESPLPAPDAILVLGSHEVERLPEAVRLARQWPGATVLLTEPVVVTPYNCQDCAHRARTLVANGVAPGRIVVLAPRVRNTYDEVSAAGQWARGQGPPACWSSRRRTTRAARPDWLPPSCPTSPWAWRRVPYPAVSRGPGGAGDTIADM